MTYSIKWTSEGKMVGWEMPNKNNYSYINRNDESDSDYIHFEEHRYNQALATAEAGAMEIGNAFEVLGLLKESKIKNGKTYQLQARGEVRSVPYSFTNGQRKLFLFPIEENSAHSYTEGADIN